MQRQLCVRPKLDPAWLLEPPPSTIRENERETAKVPAGSHTWCPANDATFEPRYLQLTELDSILAARLIRLEITLGVEAESQLTDARAIRTPLARAGEKAEVAPGARSFEAALAETLAGIYAWLFGELDALFAGEAVRPLPKRLLSELGDHASVGGMRGLIDESLESLEPELVDLARACIRFARVR